MQRCAKVKHVKHDDDKASEIDKFVTVFQLNYKNVFADATYALNRNRQIKLRRPQELPADEDVKKLKDYTVQRMNELLCDPYQTWDTHSFVEMRDLTVCRLTVFNARRGGELARLVISEWLDAEHNRWFKDGSAPCPKQTSSVTSVEFSTFKNLKVTYQGGKGVNHLVPVLIPSNVFEAMRVLSDDSIQQSAGVHPENKYVSFNSICDHARKRMASSAQSVCVCSRPGARKTDRNKNASSSVNSVCRYGYPRK